MRATARKINVPALAAAIIFSATGAMSAYAGSTSADMTVSVTVVARTLVDVDRTLDVVRVTDEDVRRGYVDVPAALSVSVRSNARGGYLLRFDPLHGPFAGGELSWGANIVRLGRDESWISQSREHQGALVMDLRLQLTGGMQPGEYPLNLRVSGDSI